MRMELEQLLGKAKDAASAVAQKTDAVVEVSKLKYERTKLTGELAALYQELGMATYQAMKGEDAADLMDALAEELDLVMLELIALEEVLDEKRGHTSCDECGEKVIKGNQYCGKCGAKVMVVEVEECPCCAEEDEEATEALPCSCGADCACAEETDEEIEE